MWMERTGKRPYNIRVFDENGWGRLENSESVLTEYTVHHAYFFFKTTVSGNYYRFKKLYRIEEHDVEHPDYWNRLKHQGEVTTKESYLTDSDFVKGRLTGRYPRCNQVEKLSLLYISE